jgi:hypothetical protein
MRGGRSAHRGKNSDRGVGAFPGVYLITPFLRYEMTTELAKFARNL